MLLLEIIYFIIFLLCLKYFKIFQIGSLPKWLVPIGFSFKVLIAIVFLSIYLHPNTNNNVASDTMRFMDESKILNNVFYKSPKDYFSLLFGLQEYPELIHKYLNSTFLWDAGSYTLVNDSRNIIRLNSILHFISFGSPFIHSLFICLIGSFSTKQLYLSFERFTLADKKLLFFILLLIPSVIFWTSGILKEPFLFLGVALLVRALLVPDPLKKKLIISLISLLLLLSFKPYNLICLLPSLIFGFYSTAFFKTSYFKPIIATIASIILLLIAFPKQRNKAVKYLSRKQLDFDNIGKGGVYTNYNDSSNLYFQMKDYGNIAINMSDSSLHVTHKTEAIVISKRQKFIKFPILLDSSKNNSYQVIYNVGGALSYIKTTPIDNSLPQLIQNIPESLVNSLLRPFPLDPGSSMKYIAMIEIWGMYTLLIIAIIFRRKTSYSVNKIIIGILFFVISLSIIIGLTTPVLGAIFRYRFLSILGITLISVLIIDPKRINFLK